MAPDSVSIALIRYRFIGGPKSPTLSTRLAICTPWNTTFGSVTVDPMVPADWRTPWWVIELSHSTGFQPSPGSGKVCAKVHWSTDVYAAPSHTWVVMPVSRLRVKNAGDSTSEHEVLDVQIRSYGTSGQLAAVDSVNEPQSVRQRSATVKVTRIGAVPEMSDPVRSPYSTRDKVPPRT